MKRKSIMIVITGLFFCVLGFLLPYLVGFIGSLFFADSPSIGIIGGADGSTAVFLTKRFLRNLDYTLIATGAVLVLSGIVRSIFGEKLSLICGKRTTLLALAISADSALSAVSALMFSSCFFLSDPSKHPIRLPVSVIVLLLSVCVFLFLLWQYFKLRKINRSGKGIAVDMGLVILCFVPFFLLFALFS